MGEMTEADRWFEQCLRDRGYDPGEHEPDLSGQGLMKSPEFIPTNTAGQQAAFEVKAFSRNSSLGKRIATGHPVSAGPGEVFGPMREQVAAAAAQLKDLAEEIPLVVVLANPEGAPVHLDVDHVLAALYGNMQYSIPIDTQTGGAAGPGQFELGRDGKLKTDHSYISAVVILHCREHARDVIDAMVEEAKAQPGWETMTTAERGDVLADVLKAANERDLPDGEYYWVDVIDTISASILEGPATLLPDEWFTGPRDTRWRHDGIDHFEQVRGPKPSVT